MKTIFVIATMLMLSLTGVLSARGAEPPPTPLVTQPAAHWIKVLESDAGREEKATACRQLAVNGTKAAVPALVKLLESEELNHMARYALETMPGVDGALRKHLDTLQGLPLAGVIATLGVREDAKSVKRLASLLGSSDVNVARAAAGALGSIGTVDAAEALRKGLVSANTAVLAALYEGWLRCAEKLALNSRRKQSLAMYDDLLAMSSLPGHVRGAAIYGGIVLRGKEDTELLKRALSSADGAEFAAALRASSDVPGAGVTRLLEEAYRSAQPERQVAIVRRLGVRGGVEGIAALAKAATAGRPGVREAAVEALGSVGKAALPMLYDLAQSGDAAVARAACEALAGIPGPEADAVVLELAKSKQKRASIELIGRRHMNLAVPVLVKFLGDADGKVRLAAVQRIGELGGPREVVKLLDFMVESRETQELERAGEALTSICIRLGRPNEAVEQVIWEFRRGGARESVVLLKVLSVIGGPKALVAVREKVSERNAEVRLAAVRALADWPDVTAAPELLKALEKATMTVEQSLALRGYIRLVRNSGEGPDQKLKMLEAVSKEVRSVEEKKLLLAALGDIVSEKALRWVATHLSDPNLAEDAAAAATGIAGRLNATFKAEIGAVLNQVLETAKSEPVLEKARKRMQELGIAVTPSERGT